MGIYTSFWEKTLKRVIEEIKPTEFLETEIRIPELTQLGDRSQRGYNGRLFTWTGSVETLTDSAVFRNLQEVIAENKQFKNKVPGYLQLRVYSNNILKIRYQPISFELLIERYREISNERKEKEKKWQLIKKFQDAWTDYAAGNISFKDFYQRISFGILVYPTVITIFAQMTNEDPAAFEKLLLDLYDESKDLKQRINDYTTGFADVYYTLLAHGKNTFQEERTIATLLAFRYPEKYTFFKDSFYTKLCKGLGIKPSPKGEKIFHYYSLVDDFIKNHLQNHADIIEEKNNRLDETCYKDKNNLILAQDILFLTLDAKETEDDNNNDDDGGEDIQIAKQSFKKVEMKPTLNQILYGPPGTGKTYSTVDKALEVVDQEFYNANKQNRKLLTAKFNEFLIKDLDKLEGQIAFCTFHQSMSYEDFVEGIKPELSAEKNVGIGYTIKDGIFKVLSRMATDSLEEKETKKEQHLFLGQDEINQAIFYKMSLGNTQLEGDEEIYDYCMDNNCIALGWGGDVDYTGKNENEIFKAAKEAGQSDFAAQQVNMFIHYLKQGNYVIISYGNYRFRAIGRITGEYEYRRDRPFEGYCHFRKVEWLLKNVDLPVSDIYGRNFQQQTLYKLNQQEIKREFFNPAIGEKRIETKKLAKNYVLIIDEINRGNVSQIFGELITLIEEDKRAGKDEALTATLPYSKKTFSVPPNLYIIGTMNTADRSVEALDTALRRRFSFEAILPDATKIIESPAGIDLQAMLSTINNRLEALLSKDHTIGHAWLMKIDSFEKLQDAFKNKILPLLQEFFYNDYAKIGLVLGKRFVEANQVGQKMFADFDNGNELASEYADKTVYTLKNPFDLKLEDFISIYK